MTQPECHFVTRNLLISELQSTIYWNMSFLFGVEGMAKTSLLSFTLVI